MIKKILPAFALLVIISSVNAQIKKGAYLLGGNIGFSTSTAKNENSTDYLKNTGINLSPAFGVAVKENIIVGFDINYSHNSSRIDNPSVQESDSYGAGIFVRKYKELGKGFYLFGQGRFGGDYGKESYENAGFPGSNYESKGYGVRVALFPGISYAVNSRLHVETGFNNFAYVEFAHSKRTTGIVPATAPSRINSFSIGSNLSSFSGLVAGFRLLLN